MINIHNRDCWYIKKCLNSTEIVFLKELYKYELENKVLTQERFSREYNLTLRQVRNIVRNLEKKGYLKKVKDGWFILEFQLTENGKKAISEDY